MRSRLLNRQSLRYRKDVPVCPPQLHSLFSIIFVENTKGATIKLRHGGALHQYIKDTSQTVFTISFDQCALPCRDWEPFTRLSDPCCGPLLLSTPETVEFNNLFDKITLELKTDYVFKNEYLVDILQIIILLMDKINRKHAGA